MSVDTFCICRRELSAQSAADLYPAIVAISQITFRLPRSRTRLKYDLETLKLLNEDDPSYNIVKSYIDSLFGRTYQSTGSNSFPKVQKWSDLILGIVLLFIGFFWTISATESGFSWWALLPGFVALGGLGAIVNGLEGENSEGGT